MLITQVAQGSANLNRLRKEGFTIALDDFGSGYSYLRYLSSMPVDLVKFDFSMVRSLEETRQQAVFVEVLARMIKDAGYKRVAEGIESEAMLDSAGFLACPGLTYWPPCSTDESGFCQAIHRKLIRPRESAAALWLAFVSERFD